MSLPPRIPQFDGDDYQPARDHGRLAGQCRRIYELMRDAHYRTLAEISAVTGDPPASVSAQLRHLRKKRFGAHTVEKKYIDRGLYVYRVTS